MKSLLSLLTVALFLGVSAGAADTKGEPKKYTAGSCCDKAQKAGKTCEHKCCIEAEKEGKVCKKCNKES